MSNEEPIQPDHIKSESKTENPPNPPPIPMAENGKEDKEKPKETWKSLTTWGKFERVFRVLEAVGIGAGFVVLIVLVGQYEEMKKARIEDERAWVATSDMLATFDIDPTTQARVGVSFRITFKNTGRTPAINVIPNIGMFSPGTNFERVDEFPKIISHSMLLPPGGDGFMPTSGLTTDANAYHIITNGADFYIAGTIWYDDIFGKHHWTRFCIKPQPDCTTLDYPPFHNTCDDAQTNQTN